jgi:TonB family protein
MRQARFRLTASLESGDAGQTRNSQASSHTNAVWLTVLAAAIYWLSGAQSGSLWPLQPAAPATNHFTIRLPGSLDFGSQTIDAPAVTKTVVLEVTTAGSTPLTVQPATISDPESHDFAVTSDGCSGKPLGTGESCTIGVTFNPGTEGVHSALLLVPTSSGARPLETMLTGIAAPPPQRLNATLPQVLDFGQVRAGSVATRELRLEVTSAGTVPLAVQAAALSDVESTRFTIARDGCSGAHLAAGQGCTIAVSFNPVQEGAHVGLLSVPTSLGGEPLQTELKGTATPRPPVANHVPHISEQTNLPVHLHVGGRVTEAVPIYDPPPAYPEAASKAGVQGTVVLSAVIRRDGSVSDVTTVSGDPTLAASATKAVSGWRYKPTELNKQPIDDSIQITVNFTLTKTAGAPATQVTPHLQ